MCDSPISPCACLFNANIAFYFFVTNKTCAKSHSRSLFFYNGVHDDYTSINKTKTMNIYKVCKVEKITCLWRYVMECMSIDPWWFNMHRKCK